MSFVSPMERMVDQIAAALVTHGVKPSSAKEVGNAIALGISRGKNGNPLPTTPGLTRDLTEIIANGTHDLFHYGHYCRLGELQLGDIITGLTGGHAVPFSTAIVLHIDKEKQSIRLARPHADGHLYGTTCASARLGCETYSIYVSNKPEDQQIVNVIGKDNNYIDYRKTVYTIASLDSVRKAWYAIHKEIGLNVTEPPTNEWELRHETWALEHRVYFGTDRKTDMRHLPPELLALG